MCLLTPKASGEFIAKVAKHVELSEEGLKKVAVEVLSALRNGKLSPGGFSQVELHPKHADEYAINWIFVIDTLNFCFWKPPLSKEKWEVTFHGKTYTGYFALCAAINRAIEAGIPMTDPNYYSTVSPTTLGNILQSDTEQQVPLLEERINCLHEVGKVLLEKYNGSFINCVKESKCSAQSLLKIITENFPCFRDQVKFENNTVSFYKRAQILIGDIWACFQGQGLGHFTDIDTIVMFADYRVPQVLVHFGALIYSKELTEKLQSDELLAYGSTEEIEIRGCSIEAVERICSFVRSLIKENNLDYSINSILIDHFLWDYRRQHATELESIPFHKVTCIFY